MPLTISTRNPIGSASRSMRSRVAVLALPLFGAPFLRPVPRVFGVFFRMRHAIRPTCRFLASLTRTPGPRRPLGAAARRIIPRARPRAIQEWAATSAAGAVGVASAPASVWWLATATSRAARFPDYGLLAPVLLKRPAYGLGVVTRLEMGVEEPEEIPIDRGKPRCC